MLDFKRDHEESAILDITPEMAEYLLSTSPGNRKIRNWHVSMLADSMSRGEWRVTSQGIGIDMNGNLRDAHHRLMAVVKSGVTIRSDVVMGLPLNSYEVIDTGIKRNLADLLHENKRITDILNAAASIIYDTQRTVPIDQMRPIMESGLYETAKSLIKHCGTARAFYSSAPIKLSACVTIMNGGDTDYVMQQYKALCLLDFKSMSTAAMSLVKQVDDGKTNAKGNKKDTIARGLRVFDVKQKDSDKSSLRQEDLEAAQKFILNVLNKKDINTETKPQIVETSPANNKTRPVDKRRESSIDDELNELLSAELTSDNSYVHKSGDRRKYAT